MRKHIIRVIIGKRYINTQISSLCKEMNLPLPNICYKELGYLDSEIEYHSNTITFNINLLQGTSLYKYLSYHERNIIILSTIYHELTHLKQYIENIGNPISPISLGTCQPVVINGNNEYMSLYIRGDNNPYMKSVYILQPNEYEAFSKGLEILIKNNFQNEIRVNVISHAVSFIREKFNIEKPVQEISNALMNLYDNGNRECSEEIMDLVTRCAICSYHDKEDYGTDKISIFLGENYEKSLKEKVQNQYDDYSLDC